MATVGERAGAARVVMLDADWENAGVGAAPAAAVNVALAAL